MKRLTRDHKIYVLDPDNPRNRLCRRYRDGKPSPLIPARS